MPGCPGSTLSSRKSAPWALALPNGDERCAPRWDVTQLTTGKRWMARLVVDELGHSFDRRQSFAQVPPFQYFDRSPERIEEINADLSIELLVDTCDRHGLLRDQRNLNMAFRCQAEDSPSAILGIPLSGNQTSRDQGGNLLKHQLMGLVQGSREIGCGGAPRLLEVEQQGAGTNWHDDSVRFEDRPALLLDQPTELVGPLAEKNGIGGYGFRRRLRRVLHRWVQDASGRSSDRIVRSLASLWVKSGATVHVDALDTGHDTVLGSNAKPEVIDTLECQQGMTQWLEP